MAYGRFLITLTLAIFTPRGDALRGIDENENVPVLDLLAEMFERNDLQTNRDLPYLIMFFHEMAQSDYRTNKIAANLALNKVTNAMEDVGRVARKYIYRARGKRSVDGLLRRLHDAKLAQSSIV